MPNSTVTLSQVSSVGTFIGMIILAFLFLETRYDAKGLAKRAELRSKIYSVTMTKVDTDQVITKFNIREELEGSLSDSDVNRRAQLRLMSIHYNDEVKGFEDQIMRLGLE